jgi:hypothetical protein
MHDFKVSKKQIELNDFEVLGVGASARRTLLMQVTDSQYVLICHDHQFLQGVLESTLQWLQPKEVLQSSDFDKLKILHDCFSQMFKVSISYFGESVKNVFKDYLQEFPWEEGLVRDHFRYFPEFVRRRFSEMLYYELFQWEWIQSYLSYADLGGFSKKEPDILKVSPTLMITSIGLQSEKILRQNPGLYACVYSVRRDAVVSKLLTSREVEILDMLSEDRKYRRVQLVETNREDLSNALASLEESDIVAVGTK